MRARRRRIHIGHINNDRILGCNERGENSDHGHKADHEKSAHSQFVPPESAQSKCEQRIRRPLGTANADPVSQVNIGGRFRLLHPYLPHSIRKSDFMPLNSGPSDEERSRR